MGISGILFSEAEAEGIAARRRKEIGIAKYRHGEPRGSR